MAVNNGDREAEGTFSPRTDRPEDAVHFDRRGMAPSTVLFFLGVAASGRVLAQPGVAESNRIGLLFYRQLRDSAPNLIMSPPSASFLVGMLLAATGETRELRQSLGLAKNFTQQLCHLKQHLQHRKDRMIIANRLYVQRRDDKVRQSFVDTLHDCFLADIRLVNFGKDADGIRHDADRWISEATNGHTKAVGAKWLVAGTKLLFLDAVYFSSRWRTRFSSAGRRPFFGDGTGPVQVPTMEVTAVFPIKHDGDLGAVIIGVPYRGDAVMYIFLPDRTTRLKDMEDRLFRSNLGSIFRGMRNQTVRLFLPEFKVNATSDMGEALRRLGVHRLFSDKANFTGVSRVPGLVGPAIVQTASLEVRRHGATLRLSSIRARLLTEAIRVDRPFLFLVRNSYFGAILFIGRISRL